MAVSLQQVQFGKESTYGTPVAAGRKIMGIDSTSRFTPRSVNTQKRYLQGNFAPAHRVTKTFGNGVLQINGDFTFEESLYLGECGIVGGVTGQVSGAGKLWTFPFPMTGTPTAVESRTIEFTDVIDPYQAAGCTVNSFELSGGSAEDSFVQFKSTWWAQNVISHAITGALTDDATVDYLPGLAMTLYANDLGGTMGNTLVDVTLIDWRFMVTYIGAKRRAASHLYPVAPQYNVPVITLDLTMESNATSKTEMAKYLATTGRLIQLKGQGPLIGGSDYKTLTIQMAGDWTQDPQLWDADNNDTIFRMRLTPRYDPGSFAQYGKLIIENNIAAVTG